MLSVIRLNDVMLSVVAPFDGDKFVKITETKSFIKHARVIMF
jgi:hypothetical protein